MKRIFFPFTFFLCTLVVAQEGTVGIGTYTPNKKAVLHLVARNNNQGLLIPKLTTLQRNNFGAQLTSEEAGMMVFDSDLSQFFFWKATGWEAVGLSLNPGAGIEISGGTIINTGDSDPTDDFSGNWEDLSNIPSGFLDAVDDVDDADNDPSNEIELPTSALTNQVLIYNGNSWGAGFLPTDGDTDDSNELQDLQFNSNILTISGIANPTQINLASYSGTNTDEQDLGFVAGVISLTGDPDNTQIDLSNFDSDVSDDFSGDWEDLLNIPSGFLDGSDDVADADASITNEIQDLSLVGDNLTITNNVSPTTIDLAPYMDNTDLLTSLSGSTGQILTYNGSTWGAADLPADGDTDDANEIQDLQFTSEVITLSGDPGNTAINLAPYMDNTDLLATLSGTNGQVLTYDGSTWSAGDLPLDGDTDDTNELQDLDLSGNILTITGIGTPTPIDLSPYSGTNTDEQDLRLTGEVISLTGDPDNTMIDLSSYMDNTDLLATLSGTNGQVLTYNGSNWGAADLPADGDSDNTNEIQDLQFASEVITLSGDPDNTMIDLSSYMDNTDLLATLSGTNGQVLTYNGSNWGAADLPADGDGDDTNELQDLDLTSNTLTITGLGSPTNIDLSGYLDSPLTEATDAIGTYAGYSGHIRALNVVNTVTALSNSDFISNVLTEGLYNSSRIVMVDSGVGSTTITSIDAGVNGQEIILISTGGTLILDNSQMNGSNLVLPSAIVNIPAGGNIKLIYSTDMANWLAMEIADTVINPN